MIDLNELVEPHHTTKALGDGLYEKNGEVFYDQRNYNPAAYTLEKMRARNRLQLMMAEAMQVAEIAKFKCLKEDPDRDTDEPVFALQKDEEYFPTFRTCVKNQLLGFFEMRNRLIDEKRTFGDKTAFTESNIDPLVDQGLDVVKLRELQDSDFEIYKKFKEELKTKSYSGAAATEAEDDE